MLIWFKHLPPVNSSNSDESLEKKADGVCEFGIVDGEFDFVFICLKECSLFWRRNLESF